VIVSQSSRSPVYRRSLSCQTALAPASQTALTPVVVRDEESLPFGFGELELDFSDLNLDNLVQMRLRHQTVQAAKGARLRGRGEVEKNISIRRQLIRKFHEILKERQEQGVGTGHERAARWQATKPDQQVSGNSANAALAASSLANAVR
jgi:hypothetical protein